jgi:hypothetical protein
MRNEWMTEGKRKKYAQHLAVIDDKANFISSAPFLLYSVFFSFSRLKDIVEANRRAKKRSPTHALSEKQLR